MSKLVPIVAALAVAGGCGLVKVKGLPGGGAKKAEPTNTSQNTSSSPTTSGDRQASAPTTSDTNAPEKKAAPPPTGARVELKPGFSPNPKLVEISGTSTISAVRDLGIKDDCSGYLGASPVVIDAPNGFKRLSIKTRGHIDLILVMAADGKYFCDKPSTTSTVPTIVASDLPAGQYKVYIGDSSRNRELAAKVRFEDLAAPATLAWLEDARPTIRLSGNPAALELRQRRYTKAIIESRAEKHGPRFCNSSSGMRYAESPDLEIDVSKRSTFVLGVRAAASVQIALVGPMTADNRDMTQKCVRSDAKMTLEPGRYFVRLGVKRDHWPTFANYYFKPVDAEQPVLTNFDGASAKPLQVAERALPHHYPFLTNGEVFKNDKIRRQLFLDVGPELMVSTRVDLDKHTAKADVIIGSYSGSDKFIDPDAALEYPPANEPLLLLGGDKVLAADGSIYAVKFKDLQPAEASSELVVPSKVRNPQLFFQHAVKMAGDDDAKRIAKRDARWDRYAKCKKRTWDRVEPRLNRLRDYPYANRGKISRLIAKTKGKVYKSCKKKKLDASERVVWKELEVSRTARRTAALEEIRQRLVALPK